MMTILVWECEDLMNKYRLSLYLVMAGLLPSAAQAAFPDFPINISTYAALSAGTTVPVVAPIAPYVSVLNHAESLVPSTTTSGTQAIVPPMVASTVAPIMGSGKVTLDLKDMDVIEVLKM